MPKRMARAFLCDACLVGVPWRSVAVAKSDQIIGNQSGTAEGA